MQENKINVLIADDNKLLVELMCDFFSSSESIHVISTAYNGLDAYNKILTVQPDVVILDIIMPKLDGLGVLEKIKNTNVENISQFIILSALGHEHITQLALNLGADFFILKPFDIVDLSTRIEQLYSIRSKKAAHSEHSEGEVSIHNNTSEEELQRAAAYILSAVGIPIHLDGFRYLEYGIAKVARELTLINSITKTLYTVIAERFSTTPARVERAIRNAIELTWKRSDVQRLRSFAKTIDDCGVRPTNSEFITIAVSKIHELMKRENDTVLGRRRFS